VKTDRRFLENLVRRVTLARSVHVEGRVQSLWSGYGEVLRVSLVGSNIPSVIVKYVEPPSLTGRGSNKPGARDHERKLRSYRVESAWYREYAARCDVACRVPRCFGLHEEKRTHIFVLEDLDASGFAHRWTRTNPARIEAGLRWLAAFHGTFLGVEPRGLWPIGTYWHLATRMDEYARMSEGPLKRAASALDQMLNGCRYKTLLHGDAKIENFCFTEQRGDELPDVAAVDFQYVGEGCAMKDVIYFLSSVLSPAECRAQEAALLKIYWDAFAQRLRVAHPEIAPEAVRAEWQPLYAHAWADFQRFLDGWAGENNSFEMYARDWVNLALRNIGGGASS
jgi:hypothetical protein